jgi:DNA-binding XRE family transcriptional regulator
MRRHRMAASITCGDMAAQLRIRRETLCRLESGMRTPSLRLAVRIERVTEGAVRAREWVREGDDDE